MEGTSKWQRGDPGMNGEVSSAEWRSQLQPEARQRIVNKIVETLKRHLPISGTEGLGELKKNAVQFEEKIYTAATSQSDYLRKISMKMLTLKQKHQGTVGANQLSTNPTAAGQYPADQELHGKCKDIYSASSAHGCTEGLMEGTSNWQHGDPGMNGVVSSTEWRSQLQPEARQRIVNKIMETLKRHLPISLTAGPGELKKIAVRFEEKIYTAATSLSDYLRKISMKMLTMEQNTQGTVGANQLSTNPTAAGQYPADHGTEKTNRSPK